MKGLAVILVSAAVIYGAFHFYFQKMPITDEGTSATQAITLTGVRGDLLEIAQAELSHMALNGNCAPVGDLLSSSSLAIPHGGRDGYTYSVECSGGTFKITAQHPAAPDSSPIRYPTLTIDSNLQISEGN